MSKGLIPKKQDTLRKTSCNVRKAYCYRPIHNESKPIDQLSQLTNKLCSVTANKP